MISVPSVRLSVRPFVRNAFSPSLMSQIFWNLVYSLSGVKVRECPSLFLIFAKFGPGGPKNGHFWPFFGHFCSFLDLKTFLESGFFLFFNMMFLGIFRSDLQKNCSIKKVYKSKKPRKWPKTGQKWPFFGPEGPNFDPFFTNFCKSLLNMPKNII